LDVEQAIMICAEMVHEASVGQDPVWLSRRWFLWMKMSKNAHPVGEAVQREQTDREKIGKVTK
jgi:hypothetical protein